MNQINPRKLLNSKWTAASPVNRQKHFVVSDVEFSEDGSVIACEIEAIVTRQVLSIDWQELKDRNRWRQGWK